MNQSFKLYETIKRFCIIGWFVRSKSQRKNLKSFCWVIIFRIIVSKRKILILRLFCSSLHIINSTARKNKTFKYGNQIFDMCKTQKAYTSPSYNV